MAVWHHQSEFNQSLLRCIWKGGKFDSVDFSFVEFLIFYFIWVSVSRFGRWVVFDLIWLLDAPSEIALCTFLRNFAVGFSVKVFRLDCRNVSHVTGNVWLFDWLLPRTIDLIVFSWGDVTHVSCDRVLLASSVHPFVSFINTNYQ